MRPEHVDELRHLRKAADNARKEADDFAALHSTRPEDAEILSPPERFDKLWDTLRPLLDHEATHEAGPILTGLTPCRLILINDEQYGLIFKLDSGDATGRSIEAAWHYLGPAGSSGNKGGHYTTYYELVNGNEYANRHQLGERTSNGLANLETSLVAYQAANPTAVIP